MSDIQREIKHIGCFHEGILILIWHYQVKVRQQLTSFSNEGRMY